MDVYVYERPRLDGKQPPRGRERFTRSTLDGKATVTPTRHQTLERCDFQNLRNDLVLRGTYESAFLGGRHHVRNVRTAPLFEEFRTLMTSTFKYSAAHEVRYSTRLGTKARLDEVELPTCTKERSARDPLGRPFEGSERKA